MDNAKSIDFSEAGVYTDDSFMFDIDFASKRARLAIRFFTYGVMAVASVVLTALLVLVALGYRLDRNFTFTQGGLMQFRSFPDSADVFIDGKRQSFHTPDKANLTAGNHAVTMSLNGYRSWTKQITLAPGQLLWLNYARMIPNAITTAPLKEYPAIGSTLPSPDRHWLLVQMNQSAPDYTLVDYSDETKPQFTNFQLPDSLFTKKDGTYGTFKLLEWDLQSKYVLIEHDNGDTVEFARLDRSRPADAVNLTKMFGLNIRQAHFSGNSPNAIFAKTDDVLRRLDVGGPTASGALVSGLRDFTIYGEDTIAFTSIQDKTTSDVASRVQQIGIYRHGKITPVREVSVNQQVKLAYNEYDTHDYLAIGSTDSPTIEIIRDATATGTSKEASVFTQFDLGAPLVSLGFSSNGRMLVAQHGNKLATYDIETARAFTKTFDFGSAQTSTFKWLDDYYLWSDDGGTLRIFEFDGTNDHEITTVAAGFDVMLSEIGRQLLSVGKNDVAHTLLLQASKLTNAN